MSALHDGGGGVGQPDRSVCGPLPSTLALLGREAARRAKGTHPGMMRLQDDELAALLDVLRREVGDGRGKGSNGAMSKPRAALAKAHSPGGSTVRLAPGQDPASREKTVHVGKALSHAAGGSEVGAFNLDLIDRTVACARLNPDDPDAGRQAAQTTEAVIAAMRAFKPRRTPWRVGKIVGRTVKIRRPSRSAAPARGRAAPVGTSPWRTADVAFMASCRPARGRRKGWRGPKPRYSRTAAGAGPCATSAARCVRCGPRRGEWSS